MTKHADPIVPNTIVQGDCIRWMNKQPEPFADLIFADPPFNIGYKYDVYEDKKVYGDYYKWTERWMAACVKVLKESGSFWVAIGDEYAAEVRMIGRKLGLNLRNWVIWYYTFGQNAKAKFARSHAHLFYFTKNPLDFVFNADAVRVMSDRQKEYNDKRANPLGRVPFDVWHEFPRVCGTFGTREGWHPCQMPEMLLARIIRACTNRGDLVYDPFAGSGTTLVAAKKHGRRFAGSELSRDYVQGIEQRLDQVREAGAASEEQDGGWPPVHVEELCSLYVETGVPTDRLSRNDYLLATFTQQFNLRMESIGCAQNYTAHDILTELARLRMASKLGRIRVHARESTSREAPPEAESPSASQAVDSEPTLFKQIQ